MENLDFPEVIAKLCVTKFNLLPPSGKPNANQWTVLSCIVKEESDLKVIALGSGSKCIGRNKMSFAGDILNDSHAEVICRRAFLAYLYEQMNNSLSNKISIFLFNSKSKKFALKQGIKFHFFTTMMPCGDASIFPKCHNLNSEESGIKKNVNKRIASNEEVNCKRMKIDDIHRTGAKCLEGDVKQDLKKEGADYHITGVVRTKPGRGDPTLSVSCTDKITKWCYLGLQGALLSIFLEEQIFLSTFIVAGNVPYNQESLQRSFFDRIGNLKMSKPFGQKLLVFYNALYNIGIFQKGDKDICPSSIIWYEEHASRKPEVIVEGKKQGVTKKNQNSPSSRSRICKAELLKSFKSLHNLIHYNIDSLCYSQCKEKAVDYQKNWKILKSVLGLWPEKNEQLLKFS